MFQWVRISNFKFNLKSMAMFSAVRRTTFLPVVSVAIGSAIALALATPAFAIDGTTAVGMCIDSTAGGARCLWNVNEKGEIDICNQTGCVYCPSATGQCSVARKRPRPTASLPAGTTVVTSLGSFKVMPHAYTGPILKAPPMENKGEPKQ